MDHPPPQLRQPAVSTPTDLPNANLTELAASLQDAAMAARYLPSAAADPSQLYRAFASLQAAHHHLSAFLSRFPPPAENSVGSTGAAAEEADELMADREEEGGDRSEGISSKTMDEVEEGMRDFALQNKRRKRRPSPNWVAERAAALEGGREFGTHDPGERMRSLDLIFQFHA